MVQIVRKNVFEELEKVKQLIKKVKPDFDMETLSIFLGRLGKYHYKKTRKGTLLLGTDRKIYNILIENSYNPYTAYKWALLERVPQEIKHQLKMGVIGQKKAKKYATKQRKCWDSNLNARVKQHGLMLIRGL